MVCKQCGYVTASLVILLPLLPAHAADWQEPANRSSLANQAMEARFQSGILVELVDRVREQTLVYLDAGGLPDSYPLFGELGIDPARCTVKVEAGAGETTSVWESRDGTVMRLRWSIESGPGDLVLHASARTPRPVPEFRVLLPGCGIRDHNLVVAGAYGVGTELAAPWEDTIVGDPCTAALRESNVHPLVALFQGEKAGWFLEGREARLSPANLMARGHGETVDIALVRGFQHPTASPELYEVRIRTYREHWQDAVDPYVGWLEEEAGMVPLSQKNPPWVRDIAVQANLRVCDFEGLEALAGRVEPHRTILGRITNYRTHPIYFHWPDYTMPAESVRWFQRAKELGFHLSANISADSFFSSYTELIERFRPGLMAMGKDPEGRDTFHGAAGNNLYCSLAYKPWRDYLVEQIRPVIEAGADVIHLDENGIPEGQLFANGESAVEGASLLVQEIMQAYPGVAVDCELHIKNIRHAGFAQIDYYADLGHPLTGYLFKRFVHFTGAGKYGQPIADATMDSYQSWGYLLPSAGREESWNQIAEAFARHNLVPDSRALLGPEQLFAYRGDGGVTAFFEKRADRRGLVLYESGKTPRWAGTRVAGIKQWPGPGVIRDWIPGPDVLADWLIYDGDTMAGLDPAKSYLLDETRTPRRDAFHITRVPGDFALYENDRYRTQGHESGINDSYHLVKFTGTGIMELFVPENWLAFLDGEAVEVDPATSTGRIEVSSSTDEPGVLLAFERSDVELAGRWVDLPWQLSPMQRNWYVGRQVSLQHRSDGFIRLPTADADIFNHVAGGGVIIGRLPEERSLSLHGAYRMRDRVPDAYGDGVIRINGREVMRIPIGPPGPQPRKVHPFDVDISDLAGQYILLEFHSEGRVAGIGEEAIWYAPQIRTAIGAAPNPLEVGRLGR